MPEVVDNFREGAGDINAVQRLLISNHEDLGLSYDQAIRYVKGGSSDALDYFLLRTHGPEVEEYVVRDGHMITAFASLRHWNDKDRGYRVHRRSHLRVISPQPDTDPASAGMFDMAKWFNVAAYSDDFDKTAKLLLTKLSERSNQRRKSSLRVRVDAEDHNMLDFFERSARPLDRELGEVTLNGVTRGYLVYEVQNQTESIDTAQ